MNKIFIKYIQPKYISNIYNQNIYLKDINMYMKMCINIYKFKRRGMDDIVA